ncbi:MAG: hypothetical protein R2762_05370 [Bryobacteraceae bacterium]
MNPGFHYDAVLKDLFQQDRPTLLTELIGVRRPRSFLNSEFAVVEKRIADLLLLLDDETILHLDFQSTNHPGMAHREGIYALMASEKYGGRRVEQIVIYMGKARMRMPDRLDIGVVRTAYRLIDIRELDAEVLLNSGNAADYALAMLARGGVKRLREIIARANKLPEPRRARVLTQMAVLSGLRGASELLIMEFKSMGISVEIRENAFLRNAYESGEAKGMSTLLLDQLEAKFAPLPQWAVDRVSQAAPDQIRRWGRRALTESTLEDVLG